MTETFDLAQLDREVATVVSRVVAVRRSLAHEDDRGAARAIPPWQGLRHVTGQSTFAALLDEKASPAEAMHRAALRRWIAELVQTRIGWDLEIDEADAVHAAPDEEAKRKRPTFAEAGRALVRATTPREAEEARVDLVLRAPRVAAARRERRARREEIAQRLGTTGDDAADLARALLDAGEALFRDLLRPHRSQGAFHFTDAIAIAHAREATEGWPAKLSSRFYDEAFATMTPRPPVTWMPLALSGASFLRGATTWGSAFREQSTARSLPFALARDPRPRAAHRFGATFGLALGSTPFQARVLGLPARAAAAQTRFFGIAAFLRSRQLAARVILASGRGSYEEMALRAFGAPLPEELAGGWPDLRVDEAARLEGMLAAHAFFRELVDRFDEDWFANPRAGRHLREIASAPIHEEPVAVDVAAIVRAFEETIG